MANSKLNRFFLLLTLFLSSSISLEAINIIKGISIKDDRLVMRFTNQLKRSDIHTFILGDGTHKRYVFDFKNTRLGTKWKQKKLSYPKLNSIRVSQFTKNIARVVVDSGRAYPIKYHLLKSGYCKIELPSISSSSKPTPSDLFSSILSNIKSSKKDKNISTPRPKKKYTIVVDAGHGGKDSGALDSSRRYMEKRVVLAIAKRVRHHLKRLGFNVHMTRSNDRFKKLGYRTRYANRKHADAFVSIHANAVAGKRRATAHGIETYFLQVTRSARAKRVAARENSVVLQKKDRLSQNVILNLMTGPKIVMSNKMAIDIHKNILKNLNEEYYDIKDNGVRPAPFWVLVGAQMPSVLVETGYITHPLEKQRLYNSEYQDWIAKGIAEGISTYFANREREME